MKVGPAIVLRNRYLKRSDTRNIQGWDLKTKNELCVLSLSRFSIIGRLFGFDCTNWKKMPNLLINANDVSNFGYSKECDLKYRTKSRDQKNSHFVPRKKIETKVFPNAWRKPFQKIQSHCKKVMDQTVKGKKFVRYRNLKFCSGKGVEVTKIDTLSHFVNHQS